MRTRVIADSDFGPVALVHPGPLPRVAREPVLVEPLGETHTRGYGKARLTVEYGSLRDLRAEETAVVESTDDLSPKANPLVVGARVYTMCPGRSAEELESGPVTVLESLSDGVAILAWWSENHFHGPMLRGQAFRADRVTHNSRVANLWPSELKRLGWNFH